jgi:hypothetical protein
MSQNAQGDHPGYQQEKFISVKSHAAATATERTYLYRADRACRLRKVNFIADAAVTGDNTNRTNLNLVHNSDEIANKDLVTTTGDLVQGTVYNLYAPATPRTMAAGDKLYLEHEKVSSGVLVPSLCFEIVIDFEP